MEALKIIILSGTGFFMVLLIVFLVYLKMQKVKRAQKYRNYTKIDEVITVNSDSDDFTEDYSTQFLAPPNSNSDFQGTRIE